MWRLLAWLRPHPPALPVRLGPRNLPDRANPASAYPPGFAERAAQRPIQIPLRDDLSWSERPPKASPGRQSASVATKADTRYRGSDAALLSALLGRVLPDGADVAAGRAIAQFGGFAAVLAQPPAELLKVHGLGTHSVAAIKLVHAAALRLSRAAIMDQPAVTSAEALTDYLTVALLREPLEHFRILFLDGDGRIRADEAQARGTVDHTPVYPREVVRRALELNAASIILVHNHPTGDPTPSPADIEMTGMVDEACGVFGLWVQDHLIIGNGRTFSFRHEGYLPDRDATPHRSGLGLARKPARR